MSKQPLDIVAIGECLVEFLELEDGRYAQSYAGDTLNTLFYASRLGLKTGYVTAIGQDPYTEGIELLLDTEKIDRTICASDDGINGTYFVLGHTGTKRYHFLRKHSAATRMLEHIDIPKLKAYLLKAKVLHLSLTSIGIQSERDRLIDVLSRIASEVKICLDSNYRASVWADREDAQEWYQQALPYVSMLFVTDTDHEAIYGKESFVHAIKRYQSYGINRLAYRMGDKGSILFDGRAQTVKAVEGLNIVDTTGAGDAYNAGFIHAMLQGRSFYDCGIFATACAATAIEESGGMAKSFNILKVMEKMAETNKSE
ncbi:MAG TPA: sugar kinase [Candidatus Kapabacteria bacterium]|nr:sugar kinase [Candidatus Kapabacteria bacterium]